MRSGLMLPTGRNKHTITAICLIFIAMSGCDIQKEEKAPPVTAEKTLSAAPEITPGIAGINSRTRKGLKRRS